MKQLELPLIASEAKLLLEALAELEGKWLQICESSEDEDEIADYGNDLIELRLLRDKLKATAVPAFGPGVENFDRTSL